PHVSRLDELREIASILDGGRDETARGSDGARSVLAGPRGGGGGVGSDDEGLRGRARAVASCVLPGAQAVACAGVADDGSGAPISEAGGDDDPAARDVLEGGGPPT